MNSGSPLETGHSASHSPHVQDNNTEAPFIECCNSMVSASWHCGQREGTGSLYWGTRSARHLNTAVIQE